METLEQLLESYVNGNIGYVNSQLDNAEFTRIEFFDMYEELYNPSKGDMRLFVVRVML